MLSKCQTRWADNDKRSKMRKHINIRVNSKIPVHIIIIINQNSHVSQLFTSLKSIVSMCVMTSLTASQLITGRQQKSFVLK